MTRTVFDNDGVAHAWAQNTLAEGLSSNRNFYFEGPALYSYGSHYMVGFILPDGVALLNADSSTPTTNGKHRGPARSAVAHRVRYSLPALGDLARALALVAWAEGDSRVAVYRGRWTPEEAAAARKDARALVRAYCVAHAETLAAAYPWATGAQEDLARRRADEEAEREGRQAEPWGEYHARRERHLAAIRAEDGTPDALGYLLGLVGLGRSRQAILEAQEREARKAARKAQADLEADNARDAARWAARTPAQVRAAIRKGADRWGADRWGAEARLRQDSKDLHRLVKWAKGKRNKARLVAILKAHRAEVRAGLGHLDALAARAEARKRAREALTFLRQVDTWRKARQVADAGPGRAILRAEADSAFLDSAIWRGVNSVAGWQGAPLGQVGLAQAKDGVAAFLAGGRQEEAAARFLEEARKALKAEERHAQAKAARIAEAEAKAEEMAQERARLEAEAQAALALVPGLAEALEEERQARAEYQAARALEARRMAQDRLDSIGERVDALTESDLGQAALAAHREARRAGVLEEAAARHVREAREAATYAAGGIPARQERLAQAQERLEAARIARAEGRRDLAHALEPEAEGQEAATLRQVAAILAQEAEERAALAEARAWPRVASFLLGAHRAALAGRLEAIAEAGREAQAARAEREAQERLERERAARESWLAGGPRWRGADALGGAYLRAVDVTRNESGQITGGVLETSQGAEVPLVHALRVFRFLRHCRATGQDWHRNGRTLRAGHYQVDRVEPDGTFRAGCHLIRWAAVEDLAARLGVLDLEPDSGVLEPSNAAA